MDIHVRRHPEASHHKDVPTGGDGVKKAKNLDPGNPPGCASSVAVDRRSAVDSSVSQSVGQDCVVISAPYFKLGVLGLNLRCAAVNN